jgi:hypothetical protein
LSVFYPNFICSDYKINCKHQKLTSVQQSDIFPRSDIASSSLFCVPDKIKTGSSSFTRQSGEKDRFVFQSCFLGLLHAISGVAEKPVKIPTVRVWYLDETDVTKKCSSFPQKLLLILLRLFSGKRKYKSNMSTPPVHNNPHLNVNVDSSPASPILPSVDDNGGIVLVEEEAAALIHTDNLQHHERRNAHKRPECIPESLTDDMLKTDKQYVPKQVKDILYSKHGKTVLNSNQLRLLEAHRVYLRKQARRRLQARQEALRAQEGASGLPLAPTLSEPPSSTTPELVADSRKPKQQWQLRLLLEQEELQKEEREKLQKQEREKKQREKQRRHAAMALSRSSVKPPSTSSYRDLGAAMRAFRQNSDNVTSAIATPRPENRISSPTSVPNNDNTLATPNAVREKIRSVGPVTTTLSLREEQVLPMPQPVTGGGRVVSTASQTTPFSPNSVGMQSAEFPAATATAATISVEAIRATIPVAVSLYRVSPTSLTTSESRRRATQLPRVNCI